ncbi:MAG: shikimate dehydrogenase, partial [Proteobacteria bacterium]|nr:shikimate dehydrogenase [Pseudomonadota bacterium]
METQTASADRYAVVGNPVAHSLSPQIHRAFAEQSHQLVDYSAIELAPGDFERQLRELQEQGLKGVNVTIPFKRQAWEICDQRSPRADDAGAVNTLVFTEDGNIAGDNTDGVGLTRDLLNNHRALIGYRKILILGAGGAVRGVLAPLLALKPDNLTLANRTLEKAEILAEDFRHCGDFQVCGFNDLGRDKFDLIINATAAGLDNEVPPIPEDVLGINSICYDMMYDIHAPTGLFNWAQR